jgi:hypothetical protein
MLVSTLVRRCSALFVVLVAASACSDATMAPRPAERPAFDIEALQPLDSRAGSPGGGAAAYAQDSTTLVIDPNVSRTYSFGGNWIYFPARSICDPATSGYGPGLWDAPCTPLTQRIRVTAHWSARGGHAFARFSPELRFVPSDARNTSRWVILSLYDHRRIHDVDAYSILYYSKGDGWVDESLTDPTLRAWLDPLHNSVVRRVKHFSGYMVAAANSGRIGGFDDYSY